MAEEKSSFGIVGRALEITKIYGGSSIVKYFDGIVERDSLKTLGEFVRDPKTSGIDFDQKADDRLARYNVVKIIPTRHLDEVSNNNQLYLITDEHGHDIGTFEITENGPIFKLSPKIKDYNKKILDEFSKQEREILDELYQTNTLEDLIGKLAKGQSIALSSKKQAKDEIISKYREGFGTPVDVGSEPQDSDEKNALNSIPADMRGQAIEFAREMGLKVKEILIVDNPKQLSKSIDNRNNQIAENGGPVILIRAESGKALDLDDDIFALQDGNAVQNEANDKILGSYMKNHEDEGHVTGLEPIDNNETINEVQRIYSEAEKEIKKEQEEIVMLEAEIENYESYEFASEEDRDAAIGEKQEQISGHNEKINNIVKNRDLVVKELLSRSPKEKVNDMQGDGVPQKDRWESADPKNPSGF